MDGERIERGEIRLCKFGGPAVPVVIISSNEYQTATNFVIVMSISDTELYGHGNCRVRIDVVNVQGWAYANRLNVVPAINVGRCVDRVPPKVMRSIDDLLESVFDLDYDDEDKDREIARLKREVQNSKEGILSRAAEVSRYKMLYEKAVEQIAEMQVKVDVMNRVAEKREPEPEEDREQEPEIPKKPKTQKKVNVNTATVRELMQVGFGKSEAARIVCWGQSCGGFDSLDDLTAVDGVTGKMVRKLRDKLEI